MSSIYLKYLLKIFKIFKLVYHQINFHAPKIAEYALILIKKQYVDNVFLDILLFQINISFYALNGIFFVNSPFYDNLVD